jgi:uncharacterized protein
MATLGGLLPGARAAAMLRSNRTGRPGAPAVVPALAEFSYGDVSLADGLQEQQRRATHAVLMGLDEDSVLKPLRQMSGMSAPGGELGGWYRYNPHYDWRNNFDDGFAPACTFGQWVSALARGYAIDRDVATREKVLRLNRLYAQTITGKFYEDNRFPTYCYDKFTCGLIDSHLHVGDPDAFRILERTTDAALPHLPGRAIEHGVSWRPGTDESYTWDESYTLSENLFLAYQRGAGERYRTLGAQYLDDEYYGPLADNHSNLAGRHAYSHVNSLCSAMQAYLTLGSERHLNAARNAFDMLAAQSYATGGWGPDETLRAPGSDEVADSLNFTHHSFETPCGSYAHFKLTRYLLRVTGDARYGDSMERVMYNTILGAKPMLADGSTFYYADCNFAGHKFYHQAKWPCCSGTLPQVAADYRLNAYFRHRDGVLVNLYLPSSVRWMHDGARVKLSQRTAYPFDPLVGIDVATSKPVEFTLRLRIPAWAGGAAVAVNGARLGRAPVPGSFMSIRREWRSGDRVELELPLNLRLEPIDARHPDTVALLCGPQVLFATTSTSPTVTRHQLLAARRLGTQSWQVDTAAGPLPLLPFTAIGEQQYSTYLVTTTETGKSREDPPT